EVALRGSAAPGVAGRIGSVGAQEEPSRRDQKEGANGGEHEEWRFAAYSRSGSGGSGRAIYSRSGGGGYGRAISSRSGSGGSGRAICSRPGSGGSGRAIHSRSGSACPRRAIHSRSGSAAVHPGCVGDDGAVGHAAGDDGAFRRPLRHDGAGGGLRLGDARSRILQLLLEDGGAHELSEDRILTAQRELLDHRLELIARLGNRGASLGGIL